MVGLAVFSSPSSWPSPSPTTPSGRASRPRPRRGAGVRASGPAGPGVPGVRSARAREESAHDGPTGSGLRRSRCGFDWLDAPAVALPWGVASSASLRRAVPAAAIGTGSAPAAAVHFDHLSLAGRSAAAGLHWDGFAVGRSTASSSLDIPRSTEAPGRRQLGLRKASGGLRARRQRPGIEGWDGHRIPSHGPADAGGPAAGRLREA